MQTLSRSAVRLWIAAACSLLPSSAWAGLGREEASVLRDQAQFRGDLRRTEESGFVVHEITAPGFVVREYSSPEGEVFGVSWRGTAMPDLAQLLGPHFSRFQQASPTSSRRRRSWSLHTSTLVVEMRGHVRDLRGRAYLPGALPRALSQEIVQ